MVKDAIELGSQFRAAEITRAAGEDENDRSIELSFSSEAPYRRWFGYEILGHKAEEVDLSILNDGAAFLKDHSNRIDDQLGSVAEARLDGDKARAVVTMASTPEADAILGRIRSGELKSISVGYRIDKLELVKVEDDVETYRATRWTPHEISLVAVPADQTVGVGRASEIEPRRIPVIDSTKGADMPDPIKKPAVAPVPNPSDDLAARTAALEAGQAQLLEDQKAAREAQRRAEITELAAKHNIPAEMRDNALKAENVTIGAFRWAVLDHLGENAGQVELSEKAVGLTPAQIESFSFRDLFRALSRVGAPGEGSAELEACAAAARLGGRDDGSVRIPLEVLTTPTAMFGRAQTVGVAADGGNLVATDLDAMSFIDILRARSFVLSLARPLRGLVGNVDIPRLDTEGASAWLAENAQAVLDDNAYGLLSFTPYDIGRGVELSRRLLMQSSTDVEAQIRDSLASEIAVATDTAAVYGAGGNSITGISNIVGVGTTTFAAAVPTRAEVIAMESEVATANADVGRLAYAFNSAMRGSLKGVAVDAGSGRFVYGDDGKVNGYDAEVSNIFTAGDVVFGNWNDAIAAQWGDLDIMVNPYKDSRARTTEVSAMMTMDFNLRHAASMCFSNDGV